MFAIPMKLYNIIQYKYVRSLRLGLETDVYREN